MYVEHDLSQSDYISPCDYFLYLQLMSECDIISHYVTLLYFYTLYLYIILQIINLPCDFNSYCMFCELYLISDVSEILSVNTINQFVKTNNIYICTNALEMQVKADLKSISKGIFNAIFFCWPI